MAASWTTIAVLLVITLHPAQAGVRVQWFEYRKDSANVWTVPGLSCVTNESGHCELRIQVQPWEDGRMRGYLNLGEYGLRQLLWQGETLEVSISLPAGPPEDAYDYLAAPSGSSAPSAPGLRKEPGGLERGYFLFLAALVLIGSGLFTLRSQRQR